MLQRLKGIWLARSADRGATWKTYKIADPDALSYYSDLAVWSPGELAATWFSGAGDSLHWHACVIRFVPEAGQPTVLMSAPIQTDSWTKSDEPDHVLVRSSAGEYLQPLFLKDGTLAIVSPVQDPKANRRGFTFWRFNAQISP